MPVQKAKQRLARALVPVQVLQPRQQGRYVVPGFRGRLDVLDPGLADFHLCMPDFSHRHSLQKAKIRENNGIQGENRA